MFLSKRFIFVFLLCTSSLLRAQDLAINLNFVAEINGEPFKCGKTYSSVGINNSEMVPTDLRLYISDIELLNSRGEWIKSSIEEDNIWQNSDVVMLDFEDATGPCRNGSSGTNKIAKIKSPNEQYKGIRFLIGVPFTANHADPTIAYAPLSTTALFWNWQNGYRFIKFDARTNINGIGHQINRSTSNTSHGSNVNHSSASGFSLHIGSTECASNSTTTTPKSCKNSNRIKVEFPSFNFDKNVLVIDIGKVLKNTDVTINTPQTSPGCMSFSNDPDCVETMNALGLPYQGKAATGKQQLISIR